MEQNRPEHPKNFPTAVLDCCGKPVETSRSAERRLFFCLSFGFSKAKITLSTSIFQKFLISIFYLSKPWKVSQTVFHRLLKTHVDMRISFCISVLFCSFFPHFIGIFVFLASFFRRFRTKFDFSTFLHYFPQSFENAGPNSEVFIRWQILRVPTHSKKYTEIRLIHICSDMEKSFGLP